MAAALILATPAQAEMARLQGVILCDTEDQIREVAEAHQASTEAGIAAFRKWADIVNHLGEATCIFVGDPFEVEVGPSTAEIKQINYLGGAYDVWLTPIHWEYQGARQTAWTFTRARIAPGEPV